jgi:hypothetical protein
MKQSSFISSLNGLFSALSVCFCRKNYRRLLSVFILPGALMSQTTSFAWLPMDHKTIDAALVYGMKNRGLGLSALLGANWVEGPEGSLLNIYSPFMIIASKVSKTDLPHNPSATDLKEARKRLRREVAFYGDPKNRINVKFAVSLYGSHAAFAQGYHAKIVGDGRGKQFEFLPVKAYPDKLADLVSEGSANTLYQGVNAYYFRLKDLELLEQFTLILTNTEGHQLSFRLKSEQLY